MQESKYDHVRTYGQGLERLLAHTYGQGSCTWLGRNGETTSSSCSWGANRLGRYWKETRQGAIQTFLGLAANYGFEQSGRGRGWWRREILQGWNWGRQIFQSETWKRELILSSSFFWGEGVGGWVLRVRPTHATTPTGLCFDALRYLPLRP